MKMNTKKTERIESERDRGTELILEFLEKNI